MSKKNVVALPLTELKETFFVRVELKEDHVDQLARLYESGAELPPLMVSAETKDVIDGRHRKAALEKLGRKEAECTLMDSASRAELILMALKANVGGPLPPSPADINHTIQLLLEQKIPRKQIVRRIGEMTPLPEKFVRRHIADVQSELARSRLNSAMNSVVDGKFTVPQAAEQFDVEIEALRKKIRGVKGNKAAVGLHEIKAGLTSKFKSISSSNAALVRKFIEDYKNGEATEKSVEEVLNHVTKCIKTMEHSHRDWVKRFEVLTGKVTERQIPTPADRARVTVVFKKGAELIAGLSSLSKIKPRKRNAAMATTALRKMGLK